jgi:FKBP-type peptidyl-prolyl cis-trans isomerase
MCHAKWVALFIFLSFYFPFLCGLIKKMTMRLLTVCIAILFSHALFAQSKKELQAKVNSLQTEVNSLNNQIAELKKPKDLDTTGVHKKASYGLGVLIASNLKSQGGDSLDIDVLAGSIKDAYLNKPLKIQQQQASMVVSQYMQKAMENKFAKVMEQSKTFLEENKKQTGVTVTASGLQYKILSSGKGKAPAATDNVTVHYTGKLIDGTEFDSSRSRGEPAKFVVNQVIPGWTEALQLMHEGDKWMLFIPSELAYGEQGAGGQIPPHAALVFEVELIKVN